jgi:hypothetical protein
MPRLPGTLSCVFASCALLAACGSGGPDPSQLEIAIDTTGDTITVRTLSGSMWGNTADLVAEVSIGALEGDDEYILGNPTQLAVAANGTIYVLDRQVPVVRAYGPDGIHLYDVGRDGGGPGEYKNPDAIAILPDGRVIVKDPGNARIAVFGPDGAPAGGWPYRGGWSTNHRYYVDTAGYSYPMILMESGLPPWEWTYGLARTNMAGEVLDTLAAPTWDFEAPALTAQREGSSSSRDVPFSPSTSFSFSPFGYFIGALSTDYRIDLYRAGDTVLRIERRWEPVPVLAAEKQEHERRVTEGLRRQYPGWRWNGPPIPDAKPPFTGLFAGEDGRIWVQLSQTGVPIMTEAEAREEEERSGRPVLRFREPAAFDVFEADGTYLGFVRAPAGFRTSPEPVARGDYVWAVVRDELDVPSIVRFRLAVRGGIAD